MTTTRLKRSALVVALALVAGGCTAGKAFRRGNAAMRSGDLDQAVAYYRTAVQADPDNANFKIALQRAMVDASRAHLERARQFEEHDQIEAARGEYQLASEYDPTNRQASAKVAALDQTIRQRLEAARPRPPIEQMREQARAATAPPLLNPASKELLNIHFTNVPARDILTFIADSTGINITYDRDAQVDRPTTMQLDGVTLEQALNQLLTMNQLSYKVVTERSIFIFPDTLPKHGQYDDQVIQTFYLSNADPTELAQLISTIIRLPGIAVQPMVQPNKTSNSITIRATSSVAAIIERVIQQNDKPRAEIVVDVEILEVNRTRAKQYGLNLSEYALGGVLSPEVSPGATTTTTPGTTTPGANGAATTTTPATSSTSGRSTGPSQLTPPPPFNLNTISRGVATSDFYLAVPTALVKFLESDTTTKLIAKPQLRGAEGKKLTLQLGDRVPVISTAFTPIAGGGAAVNPLSTYNYQDVGVNIDMTPRVTADGDVILDLVVDNSSLGASISVAGQSVPSFGQRKVTTTLRLRDGESNLLAGLLREDERKALTGFPGAIRVPVLKQLFSSNDQNIAQTDIVMLLTPHIIRTNEITVNDLKPIYIGSQQNLGLGGAPALMAAAEGPAAGAPAPPPPGTPVPGPSTPGGTIIAPPGTSPVPGTILVPTPGAAATPGTAPPPAGAPPAAAPPSVPPEPVAPPTAQAPTAATPPATPGPITSSGVGSAQVILSPPGTAFRVGGGPYTVPISIADVSRLSTITLTLTFDANVLRVRTVQEGSFMRSGGANATFVPQVNPGRVDITITRASDATGASGTGLLAAVLFEALAPGSATLTLSGVGTGPGGTPMGLQFRPVTISVQR